MTQKEKYNRYMDAVQEAYGMNKTEAKTYIKSATVEQLQALAEGYRKQAAKAFYED